MGVWAQGAVWVGAALQREGHGVIPAVGDSPEKNVQGGGIREEVFAKEGVQTAVCAREG